MTNIATPAQKTPEHKPRPLIDLLFSIVIPSVILMKFSGDNDLGAGVAILVIRFSMHLIIYNVHGVDKAETETMITEGRRVLSAIPGVRDVLYR